MSGYQYVAFRAIDGPVSGANLDYMHRQSSRAEITPWSFDNEYHYGGFRGNAPEMLRRGYDVHLQYANFGYRNLLIRLPHGLPDAKAARPYLMKRGLEFLKDKSGSGGILAIQPSYEPGHLEDLWNCNELVDQLVPLRAEILDGDLRPLYLAHLTISCDNDHDPDEVVEAPVPAGLKKLTQAQSALAELYGIGDSLIAAAAQDSPPLPAQNDPGSQHAEWLQRQPHTKKDAWLASWMADPRATDRADMLNEFRKSGKQSLWPTVLRNRTVAQLRAAAEEISLEAQRKKSVAAARQKAKRLAEMAADPARTLRETEELAKLRSTKTYRQIATLLAELREALADGQHSGLPEEQAQKLTRDNPTLSRLKSELRRQGFLKK